MICFNCGNKAETKDHVIPKALIPKPWPSNLPTAPACAQCNRGLSKDEEYLRDRLAAVVGDPSYYDEGMWDKAWRSMQRVEARGKKIGLYSDVLDLGFTVQTNEGPSDKGIRLSKARVNRVIIKMIKGFYFHHFDERLDGVQFTIDFLSSLNPNRKIEKLNEIMKRVLTSPTWMKRYGSQTWAACGIAEEDRRAGIWLFGLFGGHIVFAFVMPGLKASEIGG